MALGSFFFPDQSSSRNFGAFLEQLSKSHSRPTPCENPILGATLGATLRIGGKPLPMHLLRLFYHRRKMHMGKNGTIGILFVLCFLEDTVSRCFFFTRIWDTRKHPESATLLCFPCKYPGALSPQMPIFHGKRNTAKSSWLCPRTGGKSTRKIHPK